MLNAARRITPSSALLNSRQERPSPCRSPLRDSNEPDNPPDILTQHWFPSIVALISRVSFPGKPFSSMIFHSSFRSIVSYVAMKSMNRWCVGTLYSLLPQSEVLVRYRPPCDEASLITSHESNC